VDADVAVGGAAKDQAAVEGMAGQILAVGAMEGDVRHKTSVPPYMRRQDVLIGQLNEFVQFPSTAKTSEF